MKIIGLTGGIGSGKTTVLNLFQELGASVFIADLEAKNLMNTDPELIQNIKNLFGKKSYVKGELNRQFISNIVFKDEEQLKSLNALVHPKVRKYFLHFVEITKAKIIIYESAILFESGSDKICDFIITVTANFNDRIERIVKRDGISKEQILERMKHQLNDEAKIKQSNFVINNTLLNTTKIQVSTIYNLLVKSDK
jgi:dephospho-CoA kinase